jgi:MOSC domain-containing protein YiiM
MYVNTIELVETLLGQPGIIGQDRHGADIWSSIDRQPTPASELYLTRTGFDGDQSTQTRPKTPGGAGRLHGGVDKAIYAYPIEHYPLWLAELGAKGMGNRSLGENWRLCGVTESDVRIGDVWQLGEAEVAISKVRGPCHTLDVYFGEKMTKRMTANRLCGWYIEVLRPGLVPTRGTIRVVHRNTSAPTVAEAFAAKMRKA